MAEIATGCPLLISLVQETLRVQSTNASTRMVLKDTYLEGKYYLKKGSVLMVPSADCTANPPYGVLRQETSIHGDSRRNEPELPQYQHLRGELMEVEPPSAQDDSSLQTR